jgi:hypothetical protein
MLQAVNGEKFGAAVFSPGLFYFEMISLAENYPELCL